MKSEWYMIYDLENFIDYARTIVFNSFDPNQDQTDKDILPILKEEDKEELDSILSQKESIVIAKNFAKKQKNKKTKDIRYLISENIFLDIISSLNERMVSNMINNLVNKNLLETAFDAEANDFIFWVKKNTDEQNKETPKAD